MKNIEAVINYEDIISISDFFDMTHPVNWAYNAKLALRYLTKGKQLARENEEATDYFIEDDIEVLTEMEEHFTTMISEENRDREFFLIYDSQYIRVQSLIELFNSVSVQRMMETFSLMRINIREMLNKDNLNDYKTIDQFLETLNLFLKQLTSKHRELIE